MRVLFSALDAPGHAFPLLPLLRASREAGHEVRFATGADVGPALERAGVEVVRAGTSIGAAMAAASPGVDVRQLPEAERWPVITRVFRELLPAAFARDLAPVIAAHRPELVVAELLNPGAVRAARAAGIPVVLHGFGQIRPTLLPAELDGLPTIDICPPSLRHPTYRPGDQVWPMRPVAFAAGDGIAPEVPGDGPLVYLTLGTAFADLSTFTAAIAGLADAGARVLVAAGPRVPVDAFGPLPPQVVVAPWVDQVRVLAQADLVAHHGGSGTTLAAAAAGVPQLVWPQGADQHDNADAVQRAGVGTRFDGGGPAALAAAAATLLADPGLRVRTTALAAEVAALPDPATIAARLPELLRSSPPGGGNPYPGPIGMRGGG